MNETYVTLRGWLGGDVRHRLAGDTPVAEFRLGVTPRWFDSKRSEWVDAPTQWYTVKAWRQLADNCRDSLRRADPVVVHGRLGQSTWFKDGVERSSLEVTAVSVGHDLSLGTTQFRRAPKRDERAETRPETREETREEVVVPEAAA
jgi:single-strand DNA-binding protein